MEGRDFVSALFSPLVAVSCSADAQDIAAANGLPSLVHLLSPFGYRIQGRFQVETMGGTTTALDAFAIRFRALESLSSTRTKGTLNRLLETQIDAARYTPSDASSGSPPSLESFPLLLPRPLAKSLEPGPIRDQVNFETLTPWFTDYRDWVCKYGHGLSEHEAFEHPVAYPWADAFSLFNASHAAPGLKKPFVDPNIPRMYLLLHDAVKASHVNPEAIFAMFKKKSDMVHLLVVNSRPESNPETGAPWQSIVPEIWSGLLAETQALSSVSDTESPASTKEPSKTQKSALQTSSTPLTSDLPPVPFTNNQGTASQDTDDTLSSLRPFLGSRLTQSDFTQIDSFLTAFLVPRVIEVMIRCVRDWERDIASNRRGISARLLKVGLKYFGTTQKAGTGPVSPTMDSNGLSHDSPDFLMRKLADYAFMLRDYKFSLSTYETLKKDFQNSESHIKYLAGAQEMIALCGLLSDMTRGPFEPYVDSCLSLYKDANVPQFAERATLVFFEMLKERQLYKEAANFLVRMAGDALDLRSSLYLEQAAVCFLRGYPCYTRKYAFHLVLAGHRFIKCGQRLHGIRSYLTALETFSTSDWGPIKDHLQFTLGRQAFHLGNVRESLNYFVKLLSSTKQSVNQQNFYLREFLYVYNQYIQTAESSEIHSLAPLRVPLLYLKKTTTSLQSIDLSKKSKRNHKSILIQAAVSNNDDGQWDKLERRLNRDLYPTRTLSDFSTASQVVGLTKGRFVCVIGEPVYLAFDWQNVLQVPLAISNIFLECETDSTKMDRSVWPSVSGIEPPEKLETPDFDVEVLSDMALDANERRRFQIRIFPKATVQIKVCSLRYLLCGVVPTFISLVKESEQQSSASESNCIVLDVKPAMPMLQVTMPKLLDSFLAGQVIQTYMRVSNTGNRGLEKLSVLASHPEIFHLGKPEPFEETPQVPVSGTVLGNSVKLQNTLVDQSLLSLDLPGDMLAPGASVRIPVMIRAEDIGTHNCKFVFGYLGTDDAASKLRVFRYTRILQVVPSLHVSVVTKPSAKKNAEFILGLEVENLQVSSKAEVTQILALSPRWNMAELKSTALAEPFVVHANLNHHSFFKMVKQDSDSADTESPERLVMEALEKLVMLQDINAMKSPEISLLVNRLLSADSASLPPLEILCRIRTCWRIANCLVKYPGLQASQALKLFTLFFTDDVDMMVFWRIPDQNVSGFHHIGGINLGLQSPLQLQSYLGAKIREVTLKGGRTLLDGGRALFASTAREQKALVNSLLSSNSKDSSPVRVIMDYQEDVCHDFDQGMFILPIRVGICNSSRMNAVHVRFELILPSRASQPESDIQTNYKFLGKTCFSEVLEPQTTQEFVLHAVFSASGIYNINRWNLQVESQTPDKHTFSQSPNVKRFVRLTQA